MQEGGIPRRAVFPGKANSYLKYRKKQIPLTKVNSRNTKRLFNIACGFLLNGFLYYGQILTSIVLGEIFQLKNSRLWKFFHDYRSIKKNDRY